MWTLWKLGSSDSWELRIWEIVSSKKTKNEKRKKERGKENWELSIIPEDKASTEN